ARLSTPCPYATLFRSYLLKISLPTTTSGSSTPRHLKETLRVRLRPRCQQLSCPPPPPPTVHPPSSSTFWYPKRTVGEPSAAGVRSDEHTSELQSRLEL